MVYSQCNLANTTILRRLLLQDLQRQPHKIFYHMLRVQVCIFLSDSRGHVGMKSRLWYRLKFYDPSLHLWITTVCCGGYIELASYVASE